jgi:hypothetical protein
MKYTKNINNNDFMMYNKEFIKFLILAVNFSFFIISVLKPYFSNLINI